jgi:flagellar hook-associated protein 3 FlgL
MLRVTTNGTLKTYKYNLQKSTYTKNQAQNTVLTGRNFNSFAEDPAAAAKSFQLRRSFDRTNSQYDLGSSVVKKYDVAWSTLQSVVDDVNNRKSDSAFAEVLAGASDTSGAGSVALGQSLTALATGIVQTMNGRYGDNFIFAGADGLNVPFTWETDADGVRQLYYRGINVNATVPDLVQNNGADLTLNDAGQVDAAGTNYVDSSKVSLVSTAELNDAEALAKGALQDTGGNVATVTQDGQTYYVIPNSANYTISQDDYETASKSLTALNYMSGETKYADLGLGMQEDENGEIISSSVANVALQGINFLGYGVDEDGDPVNIVSIIDRMGQILQNCDESSGAWASSEEREEYYRLAGKFEDAAALLTNKHTELDTQASFFQSNQKQLNSQAYTLETQFLAIEDVDLADAITSYSWAQYCYNAALKVGNSILSQSLMDYIST